MLESPEKSGGGLEAFGHAGDGRAVDLDRVNEPARLLIVVTELPCLSQMRAHASHALGKGVDLLAQLTALEVAEDRVAVGDGLDLVQRCAEEWAQVVRV